MMPRPRAHLTELAAVPHGSVSESELAELGLRRDQMSDFSVNSNPLGPSPAACAAARAAVWTHYPDDRATALRRELAEREGVDERAIVVGNGSVELIWLIALAFLDPGAAVVVVGPTFGEYARAARIVGGIVHDYRAPAREDFAVDVGAVEELARAVDARLIFLCNPNNPTGRLLSVDDLCSLAGAVPGALLVVDEAYRSFADERPRSTPLLDGGNAVLLRSLTKDCALAGLRLGYVVAPLEIATGLDRVRPPWSVNAVAQAAGLAAIRDVAHLERARVEVRRARAYLTAELSRFGFRVVPSTANFLLVEVGDAALVRSRLLRHGLCVRDCSSFGLPSYVRIGMRPLAECERLVRALAALACRQDEGSGISPTISQSGGGVVGDSAGTVP